MASGRRIWLSVALAGAALAGSAAAQGSAASSLTEALALESDGHPAAAVAMAQSLIDAHALNPNDTARALDVEGIGYREMGEPEKAVRALEAALHALGPAPSQESAAVLNNLGRVYAARGEQKAAARLYGRAFAMAEAIGNHGTMARVANNQAGVALYERHDRDARRFLNRAEAEARQAPDLNDDALASIASMQGWLALNEGDAEAALQAYERALALWRDFHGDRHPMTAWGLLLVGQAEAKTGNREESARNMRDGLALLAETLGESNPRYAAAELAYAGVLEETGERAQAARLRLDVQARQGVLREQHCGTCTVSVMALR